jgi:biopolymer transport protein ExbB
MVGLAFASVVTWTVWLAKGLELIWAKRRARAATHKLRCAQSLEEAARQVQSRWTRHGPVPHEAFYNSRARRQGNK